ncbi:hypothetical protein A2U01_0048572, partial [Trifolium medium]|nr:hypothetical protein [Trifolium medium]
ASVAAPQPPAQPPAPHPQSHAAPPPQPHAQPAPPPDTERSLDVQDGVVESYHLGMAKILVPADKIRHGHETNNLMDIRG